jgi:hypothetical protein
MKYLPLVSAWVWVWVWVWGGGEDVQLLLGKIFVGGLEFALFRFQSSVVGRPLNKRLVTLLTGIVAIQGMCLLPV